MRPLVRILLVVALALPALAQSTADPFLALLSQGLQREWGHLKAEALPPHHLTLRVDEVNQVDLVANFGVLTGASRQRTRRLQVLVRVGDPSLDNTRPLRGESPDFLAMVPVWVNLPLEDRPEAVQTILWQAVDAAYKAAADKYAKVAANTAVKVGREDESADFSVEPKPSIHWEPPLAAATLKVDEAAWINRLKAASSAFGAHPRTQLGQASFSYAVTRRYVVTSCGTRVVQNLTSALVKLDGQTKADDGMDLPVARSFFAFSPAGLPGEDQLLAEARTLAANLEALRTAALVEPYSGPALLSGKAAGVFFHEIFGHRAEGHRQKDEEEGQTFKTFIGKPILPESFQIVSDPTLRTLGAQALNGHYAFDDEGVAAGPVPLVEKGVLTRFLMSRSPIQGFPRSNGHGRAELGYWPVSRQANLLVSTSQPLAPEALRRRLKEECRRQGKAFGLLFEEVMGGFTLTQRFLPNAFDVKPLEVKRVFVEDRPDEWVRGVDLVGTPLVMLSQIREAGSEASVFTGFCGAESGNVPVACAAPPVLVTQIEVQKQAKAQDKPPILPRPAR